MVITGGSRKICIAFVSLPSASVIFATMDASAPLCNATTISVRPSLKAHDFGRSETRVQRRVRRVAYRVAWDGRVEDDLLIAGEASAGLRVASAALDAELREDVDAAGGRDEREESEENGREARRSHGGCRRRGSERWRSCRGGSEGVANAVRELNISHKKGHDVRAHGNREGLLFCNDVEQVSDPSMVASSCLVNNDEERYEIDAR
jgi:hypothetical protein